MQGTSGSYEELRARIAALKSELALAEEALAVREAKRRPRRNSERTALVTRVRERRENEVRNKELGRFVAVGVAASLATAVLVVASVRALEPKVAAPAVTVTAPPVPTLTAPPQPVVVVTPTATAVPTATTVPTPPAPTATPVPTPPPVPTTPARPLAPNPYGDAMGALTIVCLPKCESIVDNGLALGPGHVFNRPSSVGRHSLVLRAGDVQKTVVVEVTEGQAREVRVAMDAPSPAATSGSTKWGF